MIEKSSEAFRTISEVAEELDLPQHVLRFWEPRFAQIKPMKRGGGRRYYRPEDINLLKGIRFLLYGEGYTIKGVQRILKEQGVRHVATVWEEMAQESEDAPAPEPTTLQAPIQQAPIQQAPIQQVPVTQAQIPQAAPSPAEDEPEPVTTREPQMPPDAAVAPVSAPVPAAPAPVSAPQPSAATPQAGFTPDDVRQLKAALFELIECKRLLDSTAHAGTA